ncbi:MAG: DUF58 domain-containing protein, partial [Planctomycetota bacterium]
MANSSPALSRYLNPVDLAALRHLVFASRRSVVGHYAGKHASPQRGHSVEFQDYRDYSPGDPLSEIDWKVYGRSDRLFIKQFEHQSDQTVTLLVDGSASMGFAGVGGPRKKRSGAGAIPGAGSKFEYTSPPPAPRDAARPSPPRTRSCPAAASPETRSPPPSGTHTQTSTPPPGLPLHRC